jgi:hypothetical protein
MPSHPELIEHHLPGLVIRVFHQDEWWAPPAQSFLVLRHQGLAFHTFSISGNTPATRRLASGLDCQRPIMGHLRQRVNHQGQNHRQQKHLWQPLRSWAGNHYNVSHHWRISSSLTRVLGDREKNMTNESQVTNVNKPVGDRDHEVLGMGSFGQYTQLYGN